MAHLKNDNCILWKLIFLFKQLLKQWSYQNEKKTYYSGFVYKAFVRQRCGSAGKESLQWTKDFNIDLEMFNKLDHFSFTINA